MSSKVCVWDAFGDFACTVKKQPEPKSTQATVPGFSPPGSFGSLGAAVTFDSQKTMNTAAMTSVHNSRSDGREGFCQCSHGSTA